jgi:hypothetical protein
MEQLFILVEHGNFQLLHDIVHQNPSLVNVTNKDGDTLYVVFTLFDCCRLNPRLHAVVYGNQPRLLEFLLSFGQNVEDFDIDAFGCSNRTPLHYAAFEGSCPSIGVLIPRLY